MATPWYSSRLRCPDCLAGFDERDRALVCVGCGYRTPAAAPLRLTPTMPRRGALALERRPFTPACLLEALELSPPAPRYAGPRASRDSSELLSALVGCDGTPCDLGVLDLGCGPRDQAPCFEHLGWRYVGVDHDSPAADVAADAHFLPFAAATFGCVFSYAVLEHLYNPFLALAEVARVLEPGGAFVGTVSQGEPFHNSFFHHTPWGLLSVMAATPGLRPVRLWAGGGDTLAALARMGRYPRVIRWLLGGLDGLHESAPWLAPRRARWPGRARVLDRLYRASSICFLAVREDPAVVGDGAGARTAWAGVEGRASAVRDRRPATPGRS